MVLMDWRDGGLDGCMTDRNMPLEIFFYAFSRGRSVGVAGGLVLLR